MSTSAIERYEPWRDNAGCLNMDPDLWFPERGQDTSRPIAVCVGRCAVQEQCLQYALDTNEKNGIWGGTTGRERRYIRGLGVTASEYIEGKANGTYTYNSRRGRPSVKHTL